MKTSKVDVLRDSLVVTPYREFERQFGEKTLLAGLRLIKQLMVVSKITFEVVFLPASTRSVPPGLHFALLLLLLLLFLGSL
jgi:hypothetical protein